MRSCIEGLSAFLARGWIGVLAGKRFLFKVYRHDVLSQGCVLAKCLVARWVLGTAEFVSSIVSGYMSSESSPSHESFPTAWTVTDVVANGSMGAFNVVI